MPEHKIVDRARGRWREILPALGVDSRLLDGKQHGCPVCGEGKDRFRFDDLGGAGTWFCNRQHGGDSESANGSSGSGFALIMDLRGVDFAEAARLVEALSARTVRREPPLRPGRRASASQTP